MASIAIIGTGISGLGAASLLHPAHAIAVYEKADEVGGHTRTRVIRYGDREIAVDTGFIVFNHRNYPNLTALFKQLDVPVQKSNMSFGVTAGNGALEWSAQNVNGLFGQRGNIANPAFYRFLIDIMRFNARAVAFVARMPEVTLGELVRHMKLCAWFTEYYLTPMGAAIWSCPTDAILQFPAKTFIDFFDAHGLLTVTRQPQWHTVTGGSHIYLKRIVAPFADRIRTACAAVRVIRDKGKIRILDACGDTREYDHVVLACHGDQALALLGDATEDERAALGAFKYQKNIAVLHKDAGQMPKRKRCWASWVYHAHKNAPASTVSVTYWMNQLQGIDDDYPLFVTLNPQRPVAPEHVFDTHTFEHPVYSMDMLKAQKRVSALQGANNTWFCGAHLKNGFHEDGLASAIDVAKRLGAEVPWH